MKTTATILSTAIAGVCLVCAPVASAIEAAITDDTYVYSTTANGAAATMVVQASTNKRVFLNFALQQTPASSPRAQDADGPLPLGLRSEEVTRAVLRMYANTTSVVPTTLRVRAVTSAWSEATLKSTLLPTWDTTAVEAEVQLTSTANEYVHFDITNLVKDWVKYLETSPAGAAGGRQNFGLMIECSAGTGIVTFDTKESTANFYESVIQLFIEPATVPQRGDVSMGIFTTP